MVNVFRPDISPLGNKTPQSIMNLTRRTEGASAFLHHKLKTSYTPLRPSAELSRLTGANVLLKMESSSPTGAYKSRGALNATQGISKGVTASAGNHAQGFGYSCAKNNFRGTVFMPTITPDFKVQRTERFGGDNVDIRLVGDNFDEAAEAMRGFARDERVPIIHPFDDLDVIAGQGTIAIELLAQMQERQIHYVIIPIGGGGISTGMATWFAIHSPQTQIIAVEPENADAMKKSLEQGTLVTLGKLDTFVDGAAVKTPGKKNFRILKILPNVHYMTVSPGAISTEMCRLHDNEKKVIEPAGALSTTAVHFLEEAGYPIKGKNVICMMTGGNIDMGRWSDIRLRSLEHLGHEKEFKIAVKNSPGELRKILEIVDGNQITLLRFDHLEGPDDVACTIRLRNIRQPHKIAEFEEKIRTSELLWGDRPEESVISEQHSYPYRKHFLLNKLPDRPGALLQALGHQGPNTNIIGFDYYNQGFEKARCSITIASKTENDLRVFISALEKDGFI